MKRDGVEWDTDFEETFFQLVSRRMNMKVLNMMMIIVIMNEGYLVGKQFEGDVEGKKLTATNDEGKKASSKKSIVFLS